MIIFVSFPKLKTLPIELPMLQTIFLKHLKADMVFVRLSIRKWETMGRENRLPILQVYPLSPSNHMLFLSTPIHLHLVETSCQIAFCKKGALAPVDPISRIQAEIK
jgi:hypothetical protein